MKINYWYPTFFLNFRFVIFIYTTMVQRTYTIATLILLATVLQQGIAFLIKMNHITLWKYIQNFKRTKHRKSLNKWDLKVYRNCYNYKIHVHVVLIIFSPFHKEYIYVHCIKENWIKENLSKMFRCYAKTYHWPYSCTFNFHTCNQLIMGYFIEQFLSINL